MSSFVVAAASALWLGVLTSISPCPLATNIAAISYLGNQVGDTSAVLGKGLLYTLGRTATYVALAALSAFAVFSIPNLSLFLQRYMNRLMGPVLIVVGLAVLEILPLPSLSLQFWKKANGAQQIKTGAGFLGVLFALSFCPTSAALFFGSLIPLAIASHSVITLPAIYGIGTAIPVACFAVLIAFCAKSVTKVFQRLSAIERWLRWITGGLFVLIGIYFCATYLVRNLLASRAGMG